MATEKQMRAAIADINQSGIFEEKIDLKGTWTDYLASLLEAKNDFEPSDKKDLKPETWKMVQSLKKDSELNGVKKNIAKSKKAEAPKAPVKKVDSPDFREEAPEEPAKKEPVKKTPVKKEWGPDKKIATRTSSILDVLLQNKSITEEELIIQAEKVYAKAGGDMNPKMAKRTWTRLRVAFVYLGMVRVTDGTIEVSINLTGTNK